MLAISVGRDGSPRYRPDVERVVAGLARAKKSVGVLAPNAVLARAVVEAATQAGCLVPDQIAVIGVNDDPLVCESTDPPLSAVAPGVERAKRLLTETNDPVTNIVFASGFNSRQVFSNIFRRETGMTPSQYRGQFKIEVLR